MREVLHTADDLIFAAWTRDGWGSLIPYQISSKSIIVSTKDSFHKLYLKQLGYWHLAATSKYSFHQVFFFLNIILVYLFIKYLYSVENGSVFNEAKIHEAIAETRINVAESRTHESEAETLSLWLPG